MKFRVLGGLLLLFAFSALVSAQDAVLKRNSNLRAEPSASSDLIETVSAGTSVTIISAQPEAGYIEVRTPDGNTGWIYQRNLAAPEKQEGKGQSTGNTASLAGNPQIYPHADLTPGKANPGITQENIAENICKKGWSTSSVRPPTSVTSKIKKQTMAAYGFADAPAHYELDHLISLQDGGCPDCVENLWPEAYGDKDHPMTQNERAQWNRENPGSKDVLPGALEKDLVENHVHDEICFGIPDAKMSTYAKKYPPAESVTLKRGQVILSSDWYSCYLNMMDGNKPCK